MSSVKVPKNSSWNAQSHTKKSHTIAPLEQETTTPNGAEAQPLPVHTPLAANWSLTNNLMRSLDEEEATQTEADSLQYASAAAAGSGEDSNTQPTLQTKLTIGQPGDKYEQEADRMAAHIVQRLHSPGEVQPIPAIQRKALLQEHATPPLKLSTPTGDSSQSNLIQRKLDESVILNRFTKASFKKSTYEGVFARRGSTLEEIERLLEELHGLIPIASIDDVNHAIELATSINELMEIWMEDHEGDTSRENRMAGMRKFHTGFNSALGVLSVLRKKSNELIQEELKSNKEADRTPLRRLKPITPESSSQSSKSESAQTKAIKAKHEGNAKSMFTKLGWMLDASVPTAGDKSKLEIEFKITVAPGAFIGGRFTCEGERETDSVKARGEMAVTGGAKVANIAEIKGELGGYIEAQAANSEQVMQLISYSMYRRFEESQWLPRKFSNFAWGGSSSSVGFKRADRWAAAVEKEVFGDLAGDAAENTYVETGGLASVGAEVGAKFAKIKGQVKGTTGRRIDQESIKKLKQGGLGSARKNISFGETQEVIGKESHALELSAGIEAGMLKGEGKVKWSWLQKLIGEPPNVKKQTQLKGWELELSAAASLPMNELIGNGVGPYIGNLITSTVGLVRSSQEKDMNKAQGIGAGFSAAEDATLALTQLAQLPQEQFKPSLAVEPDSDKFKADAKQDVKLTLKLETGDETHPVKGSLSLDFVKTAGFENLDVGAAAFKASFERSKRIIRVKREGGQWSID